MKETMDGLREELQHMASNKHLLEEQVKHLNAQIGNANAQIESLNGKVADGERQSHHKVHELTDRLDSFENANNRMKEMIDQKSTEILTLTNQLKQVSAQMREVRESKRVAEGKCTEAEARLADTEKRLVDARSESDRLRAAKVVVEENSHKLKHSLKVLKQNMQAIETTGNMQIMATKKTMDELRRRCEVSDDLCEDLKMKNDKLEAE